MITDLTKAIYSRYNSDSGAALRSVLTGGFYLNIAEDSASHPLGTYTLTGSTVEDFMGHRDDRIETFSMQVDLYSEVEDGGIELGNIVEKFQKLFDRCTLEFPSGSQYKFLSCLRKSVLSLGYVDELWRTSLDYEIMFLH